MGKSACFRSGLAAAVLMPAIACAQGATVILSQRYAQVQAGQTLGFAAAVSGNADQAVTWQVDNVVGGSTDLGTITASGVFTAPASPPASGSVTVTAVSAAVPQASGTATITLVPAAAAGQTYYVAPTGNDTGTGTMAAPFRTIQHAADLAAPGDTVLVRQGVYNALLAPTHSGSATGGYITFSSYPGELATIDGTGLPVPGGQAGLVTLADVSFVVVQGFELRNYTTARRSQVPIGIYVTGAGSNVQLVNNHVHAITTTAATTPQACGSDALGVAVYGSRAPAPIANLVISGNEVDHNKTGCSETVTLNGNVTGFTVASNLVHDNDNIGIDAIGFEAVSPDPAYDQARMGEIRGNTVYNITSYGNPDYGKTYASDGIYVDGGTNIVIEQNLVHNADLGIELASEHKGRLTSFITARNNVVYAGNSAGISIGGYGAGRGGTQDCTVVNNTLYGNDTKATGSGEIQIQYNAAGNVIANNVAYASKQALLLNDFTKSTAAPATLDTNLYFSPKPLASNTWVWNGHAYGFASYQQASSQDAQSAFADPDFTQTAAPPLFTLAAGSPALGTGANLGAGVIGTVDFAGQPRAPGGSVSIGAYAN